MFLNGFVSMDDFLKASKSLRTGGEAVNIWLNLERTDEYPIPVSVNMAEARVGAHSVSSLRIQSANNHFQIEMQPVSPVR
jgi:hypothetical protein